MGIQMGITNSSEPVARVQILNLITLSQLSLETIFYFS